MEQLRLASGVLETPLETCAREGRLMAGCVYGAKQQKRNGRTVIDRLGNVVWLGHCNMLCEPGERYCPRHLAMMQAREAKKLEPRRHRD